MEDATEIRTFLMKRPKARITSGKILMFYADDIYKFVVVKNGKIVFKSHIFEKALVEFEELLSNV